MDVAHAHGCGDAHVTHAEVLLLHAIPGRHPGLTRTDVEHAPVTHARAAAVLVHAIPGRPPWPWHAMRPAPPFVCRRDLPLQSTRWRSTAQTRGGKLSGGFCVSRLGLLAGPSFLSALSRCGALTVGRLTASRGGPRTCVRGALLAGAAGSRLVSGSAARRWPSRSATRPDVLAGDHRRVGLHRRIKERRSAARHLVSLMYASAAADCSCCCYSIRQRPLRSNGARRRHVSRAHRRHPAPQRRFCRRRGGGDGCASGRRPQLSSQEPWQLHRRLRAT